MHEQRNTDRDSDQTVMPRRGKCLRRDTSGRQRAGGRQTGRTRGSCGGRRLERPDQSCDDLRLERTHRRRVLERRRIRTFGAGCRNGDHPRPFGRRGDYFGLLRRCGTWRQIRRLAVNRTASIVTRFMPMSCRSPHRVVLGGRAVANAAGSRTPAVHMIRERAKCTAPRFGLIRVSYSYTPLIASGLAADHTTPAKRHSSVAFRRSIRPMATRTGVSGGCGGRSARR